MRPHIFALVFPLLVLQGSQGSGEIKMSRDHQSPHYTTLWSDIPKTTVR